MPVQGSSRFFSVFFSVLQRRTAVFLSERGKKVVLGIKIQTRYNVFYAYIGFFHQKLGDEQFLFDDQRGKLGAVGLLNDPRNLFFAQIKPLRDGIQIYVVG